MISLHWIARHPSGLARTLVMVGLVFAVGCGSKEDGHDDHEGHEEEGGHEGHDEHGSEVALTVAQMESAGVKTAVAKAAELAVSLRLVASVVPNLDSQAHVNPKVSGVVSEIHAKLGATVKAGDPLCEIESVELGEAVADYVKDRSILQAAEETAKRNTALFQSRLDTQTRVLDGAVAVAKAILDREESLKDRELSTLRPYLEADKAFKIARFERERTLTLLRAERDARLLELAVAVRMAGVELQNSINRLRILGMTAADIAAVRDDAGKDMGHFMVRAPIAGVVTRRDATLSEFASTGTELFSIDNLSRSWIEASVYEKDLAAVRVGQDAEITLNAFPARVFKGKVTYVSHSIDTVTRAAPVRIEVDNGMIPEWKEAFPIRQGMFGTARLTVTRIRAAVSVPLTAVVVESKKNFIFVAEEGEERTFAMREVHLGRRSREAIEVLSGVDAGESVAISGTFELKSLLQAEKLGGGHSH